MRSLVFCLLLTGTAYAQPEQATAGQATYGQAPTQPYAPPQPTAPAPYGQPGYAPPPGYGAPGYATPAPAETDTGARPGNVIGTGMSLPRSDTAGNLNAATTHSDLAPNLPVPEGVDSVYELLLTARQDLAANRTGAAQEALERAETRVLDRDITPGTERIPDQSPEIAAIAQARDALANNNLRGAIAIIDQALRRR